MRKEISVTTKKNVTKWANVFIVYGEGVRLPLEDMENIFGEEFLENVERDLGDSEPLYADYDGDKIQAITIPTLLDGVLSTEDADRIALYSLLGAVEDALVNVWG